MSTAVSAELVSWRVSSYSTNGGGNCVEAGAVRDDLARIAVRDTKNRAGGILVCAAPGWRTLLAAL